MTTRTTLQHFKVSAPTRADLAGGTLDLWPLYTLFGSSKTLNVALDLFAHATFLVDAHPTLKVEMLSMGQPPFLFYEPIFGEALDKVPPAYRFPVALVSQYLNRRSPRPALSLRISFETQAPLRSGLGGSSTLAVALGRGLGRIFNEFTEQGWQWNLMSWVRDLEAAYLTTPTGTQDYLAALFGGANTFEYSLGKLERDAFDPSVLEGLSDRLLVLFSGEMHHSGMSNWELFKRAMEKDQELIQGLRQIREVAENLDRELRAGEVNWGRVGHFLNEEWKIRKNTFKVETPRLESILSFLSRHQVLGAKVCGAAQGGSLIALVEPGEKEKLAEACRKEGIQVLKTRSTAQGVTIEDLT